MNDLNLIIPMVGSGKRFKNAGYSTYKPFIPIQGKPMVQYVTDAFPASVKKHIVTSFELLTHEQRRFLEKDLNCHLIDVPLHQDGPAYSIYQARNELPLDERFFIVYCDIFWTWDFDKVLDQINNDGIIFTRTGFHPHLVKNNYSAFCLPSKSDPTCLQEIREKTSFTDDWLSEPLSIGAFYIKNGHEMVDAIQDMVEKDSRVSNEFFPSLIFNTLVKNNKTIRLQETDFFIHWGVPEQLNDFLRWKTILSDKRSVNEPLIEKNIMMMGGTGSRMKSISDKPKGLLEIDSKPLYQFVCEHFPAKSTTIIVSPEVLSAFETNVSFTRNNIHPLKKQTDSQYETLLESQSLLTSNSNYFLSSCDAYGLFSIDDFLAFTKTHQPDAIIFTFKPSMMQTKLASQHTHVSIDNHRVTAVHFKSKSSNSDLGLAGFFWICDGGIFETLTPITNKTIEYSADHVFEDFVENNLNIMHYPLEQYIHLGTPEEYLEFQYWWKYANVFTSRNKDVGKYELIGEQN